MFSKTQRGLVRVRLIDGQGNLVKNKAGGAAFSYAEARRFLEGLGDREG